MANVLESFFGPSPKKEEQKPKDDVNKPVEKPQEPLSQKLAQPSTLPPEEIKKSEPVDIGNPDEPYVEAPEEKVEEPSDVHVVENDGERKEYHLPEEMMHGLKELDSSIQKDTEDITDMEKELGFHNDNIEQLTKELEDNQNKKEDLEKNIAKTKTAKEKKIHRREDAIKKANEAVKKLMSFGDVESDDSVPAEESKEDNMSEKDEKTLPNDSPEDSNAGGVSDENSSPLEKIAEELKKEHQPEPNLADKMKSKEE